MYVLDSDIITLFLHHKDQQPNLVRRILSTNPARLWTSIITVEEILNGAMSLVHDSRRLDQSAQDCQFLRRIMGDLASFQILPFDREAKQIFEEMTAAQKRIGKNDCKISAIAHSRGFTVVTRNVSHFREIGLDMMRYAHRTQDESWALVLVGDTEL